MAGECFRPPPMPTQAAPHLTAQSFVFIPKGPLADQVTPWFAFQPPPPLPTQLPPRLTTQAFAFLLTGPLGELTPVAALRPLPFPAQPVYFVLPPAPSFPPSGPLGYRSPAPWLRPPAFPEQLAVFVAPPPPPAPYSPVGPLGYGFIPWWGPGRPLPATPVLQTDDLYSFPQLGPLGLAVMPEAVLIPPPPAPTQGYQRILPPGSSPFTPTGPLGALGPAWWRPPGWPVQDYATILPPPPAASPYFPMGPLALFQQPRGMPAWPPIVVVQLTAKLVSGVKLPPPLSFPPGPPLRVSPDARVTRRMP